MPEPPPPAPSPATPAAEAPPAPTPAPAPAPTLEPTLEPIPSAVGVRSAGAGDCPECRAGEMAVTAVLSAGPATGARECGAAEAVATAMERLAATAAATLTGYTGPLIDPGTGHLTAAAGLEVRGEVEPLLAPYLDPAAPCQVLAVVLPARARYMGYAYAATDASGGGACVGDEPCDIGLAAWAAHPVIRKGEGFTVLYGIFINRSPNRERRAALTAYFTER